MKEIHEELTARGHTTTSAWVNEGNIIPYERNSKTARSLAAQCIKESANCDVFVLITDEQGAGMYTELGAALHSNIQNNKPRIYVIGDYLDRSMFFFHPSIKRLKSIDEVLKDLEK